MLVQEKLDGLSPFVTTIRYSERPIIDISFPPTWGIPESKKIMVTMLNSSTDVISQYMVYGVENVKVSIDDLLDFMTQAIKLNKEREVKGNLLQSKIQELNILFDKTPLIKLEKLTFTFKEVSVPPTISLGRVDEEDDEEEEENIITPTGETMDNMEPKKPNTKPVETDVRVFTTDKGQKIDLPPKNGKKVSVVVETHDTPKCNCAEGEICPECVDI